MTREIERESNEFVLLTQLDDDDDDDDEPSLYLNGWLLSISRYSKQTLF